MMMGAPAVFEPVQAALRRRRVKGGADPPRMTPARKRALEIAGDGLMRAKGALAAEAGCSTGVIDGLVAAGTLVEVAIPERRCPLPQPGACRGEFGDAAGARPRTRCAPPSTARAFSVTLLDGVTGSGKTEVYFEAVARTLEQGRQALIMLPEIALTSQFMDRFTRASAARRSSGIRRCRRPSAAAPGARAANGEARVVVGARSALFLPFTDLGLIVVDEEHDAGFKQEDRVHYQARDMAVVRGSLGKLPVVLASATPSIESHVNARIAAATRHVDLPGRYSGAELPDVAAIDLRQHPPERGQVALAGAGRGRHRDARQRSSRRCCSSTAAATRRSRCAAPAATASTARSARPGWSSTAFAHRLNCHHCGFSLPIAGEVPQVRRAGRARRLRPGRGAHRRGGGRALSRGARGAAVLRPGAVADRDARDHQEDRGGRGRHHHRHADGGQGPPLPAAGQRRHRRRRSRARPGRPARRPSARSSSCTR